MNKEKSSVFGGKSVKNEVKLVPMGRILPNPLTVRNTWSDDGLNMLCESIKKYGILQPLTVRAIPPEVKKRKRKSPPQAYELISGERRFRAAKQAGLEEVPCVIVSADDRLSAELTLAENVGREELGFFDEANAMATLIDVYGLRVEEVAGVFGITKSAVTGKLRLLRLTSREKMLITASEMTERHAKAILKICDAVKRLEVIKEVARRYLSVSATEELVDRVMCPREEAAEKDEVRKIGIKDSRIVFNTINRAIESIEKNGIPVEKERRENEIELVFRIKKAPAPTPVQALSSILVPS